MGVCGVQFANCATFSRYQRILYSVIAELGEGEFATVGVENRGFLYRLIAAGLYRLVFARRMRRAAAAILLTIQLYDDSEDDDVACVARSYNNDSGSLSGMNGRPKLGRADGRRNGHMWVSDSAEVFRAM